MCRHRKRVSSTAAPSRLCAPTSTSPGAATSCPPISMRCSRASLVIERLSMPKLPMTFACGLYDRMTALYTGEVKADGIDLNFIAVHDPRALFDRMAARQEFD